MRNTTFERIIFFLIGCAVVLVFLFLTGADTAPQIGRYQMEVVVRRDFSDVYVIDTTSGRVKWLDDKDENKPFDQIKAK